MPAFTPEQIASLAPDAASNKAAAALEAVTTASTLRPWSSL